MEDNTALCNENEVRQTRAIVTRLTPEDTNELELIDFLTMLREMENK